MPIYHIVPLLFENTRSLGLNIDGQTGNLFRKGIAGS
jgi:hypothetical protein